MMFYDIVNKTSNQACKEVMLTVSNAHIRVAHASQWHLKNLMVLSMRFFFWIACNCNDILGVVNFFFWMWYVHHFIYLLLLHLLFLFYIGLYFLMYIVFIENKPSLLLFWKPWKSQDAWFYAYSPSLVNGVIIVVCPHNSHLYTLWFIMGTIKLLNV
jgi:hypothetical protein